jgi:hypothetical protein
MNILADAKGEVPDYFRSLGFKVSWDFSKISWEHWWEIYDGDITVQIDQGVALADILEDLECIAEGRETTSKPIYKISCNKGVDGVKSFVNKLFYEKLLKTPANNI